MFKSLGKHFPAGISKFTCFRDGNFEHCMIIVFVTGIFKEMHFTCFAARILRNPFYLFSRLEFAKIHFTRFRGWNFQKSILLVFAAGILKLPFYSFFDAAAAAAVAGTS